MILFQVRLIFGQISGQVELWSDVPPRMRPWVKMKFGQNLGQVDLCFRCSATSRDLVAKCDSRLNFKSGLHLVRIWVRLYFGQMYPPKMRLQVRVTFSQTLGQVNLWFRCTATSRDLVAKCDTTSGQVDIWSYFGSG